MDLERERVVVDALNGIWQKLKKRPEYEKFGINKEGICSTLHFKGTMKFADACAFLEQIERAYEADLSPLGDIVPPAQEAGGEARSRPCKTEPPPVRDWQAKVDNARQQPPKRGKQGG